MPLLSIILYSRAIGLLIGGVVNEWLGEMYHEGCKMITVCLFLFVATALAPFHVLFSLFMYSVDEYFVSEDSDGPYEQQLGIESN